MLNEAINQGIIVRAAGGPEFASVTGDAGRELRLPAASISPAAAKPSVSTGVNETTEAALDLTQLQDFADGSAATLTKVLAGATPEFAVKIRLKGKRPSSLAAANEVLKKINPDWKFGD